MNERVKDALQNYGVRGYNCAQAILCAYADEAGLDRQTAYRLAEGLGGGVGGMQEVCGAFSAACAVISARYSDGQLEGGRTKAHTYETVRRAAELFRQEHGSIVCREILHGGKPCHGACGKKIRDAAEITGKLLAEAEA